MGGDMSYQFEELTTLADERFGEKIDVPRDIRGVETLKVLLGRSTHRHFSKETVSSELLQLLQACALSAPSKSDLQQVDIVNVTDIEVRKTVADLVGNMEWIKSSPVFLVICGNGRRLRQISQLHGESFANNHFDAIFNPIVDAGLVLAHLLVACEAVGLGTCPISVIRDHATSISSLLTLPSLTFPVAGVCIGWPVGSAPIVPRLPLSVTTHSGVHNDDTVIDSVQAYDKRRGRQTGWCPEAPDFVGWSLQKARMYAKAQRHDFGHYLLDQGFKFE